MQFSTAINQGQDLIESRNAGQTPEPGQYTQIANTIGVDPGNYQGFLDAVYPNRQLGNLSSQQQAQQIVQMRNDPNIGVPSGLYGTTANELGTDSWEEFRSEAYPNVSNWGGLMDGIDFSQMSTGGDFSQARQNVRDQASQSRNLINEAYTDAREYLPHTFQQQLQPQMQQAMNQMGARGMLDSSVMSDATAQVNRGVSQDILGQQAQLAGQEGQALAQLQGDVTNTIGRISGQEAQTRAQLQAQEYQTLANMLPFLLENQVPEGTEVSGGGAEGSSADGAGGTNSTLTWDQLTSQNDSYKDIMGDVVAARNNPSTDIEPGAYTYSRQQFNEQYPDYQIGEGDWETYRRYANT